MKLGKIKKYVNEGNRISVDYENGKANVYLVTDEIVRFEIPCWMENYASVAIEGSKEKPCNYKVSDIDNVICIENQNMKVKISDDFFTEILDAEGKKILSDYRGERIIQRTLSDKSKKELAAEGHDISNLEAHNYKVQIIKEIGEGDCFYGLGDKTGYLNKRDYAFENWNSDIPQIHNENMPAIYKSIPFMIGKTCDAVYGLFFDNTFHSYMDFGKENSNYFYYGADDGNLNYYFLYGKKMTDIIREYTYLTGRTGLPQLWTLGYHQCRWGYESADDIRAVAKGMRDNRIPCESVQYDIDYMDGYRVFTWDDEKYGKPGDLISELEKDGFKAVVIIDPATKKEDGYFMYDEGVSKGYFATNPDGSIYVNKVWPGDATFPDFGREEVRRWWAGSHKILTDMGVKAIWNDMNEPASFEGPLPDDTVFEINGRITDHREFHNVYGHFEGIATYEGMKKLTGKRPLVITRACYSGSQKYCAVWTGDNQSIWAHLRMLIPQLCNLGMSGFSLAGTDIGGFGADTNKELLCRWIEAAVFSPFFRNHSAKGSKAQEPWKFDEQVMDIYRKHVELRYTFLPYIYDLFYQGLETGLPVMRPLVLHYEDDVNTYNLNDEFLVGENVLVSPVVEQGATKKLVYLPRGTWYDYFTGQAYEGMQYIVKDAPLDVCPIFIRERSIIPTYEVVQYVGEKTYDRLILVTTPGDASYDHFQDNGEDYQFEEGKYNLYRFTKTEDEKLVTELIHEGYKKYEKIDIRRL